MSLLSTADAVLQLMLRSLPAKDIIAFARCSQQTMRIAAAPAVWKHALFRLELASDASSAFVLSPLLRHASFVACVQPANHSAALADAAVGSLLQLGSQVRLIELDLSGIAACSHKQAMRLFKHPSMKRLRVLLFSSCYRCDLTAGTVKVIAALPELHTLRITNLQGPVERWAALPRAPALTSLHLVDGICDTRSCLPYVARCAHLKHFSIASPSFYHDHTFRDFFASPCIQQLVSLTIEKMYAAALPYGLPGDIDPAEYRVAFAGMRCLTSLHLIHVTDIVALLPALALAPALTRLDLSFYLHDPAFSEPALRSLLQAAPRLHVVLTASDSIWKTMRPWMQPLLDSQRISVHVRG